MRRQLRLDAPGVLHHVRGWRVLGSGRFIEGVLEETEKRPIEALRLRGRKVDLKGLGRRVSEGQESVTRLANSQELSELNRYL